MPPINDINAGEILLREVCIFFNHEAGYDRIEDHSNIHPDDKQELLRFINKKTDNNCEFGIRALDRFLKDVKENKLLKKIPSDKATLCTLCYIALKQKNSELQFKSQTNHNATHGQSFYASDFNKEFIEPLLSFMSAINDFANSCWYLYINNVDNVTGKRMTSRKILKFKSGSDNTIVEYFSTDTSLPDWQGNAEFDTIKREIRLKLKTPKNEMRDMRMIFQINQSPLPQFIEGDIAYTTMKELDTEKQTKIYLQKVRCDANLSLKELNGGEDFSIQEIEDKLKETRCVTRKISLEHRCHD